MRLIWFSLLIACFSFFSLSGQCTYRVGGYDSSYTVIGSWAPNYLLGVKHTVPQSGIVTSLNLFGLGTKANVQMALFNDSAGVPNNLVVESIQGKVGIGNLVLNVPPTFLDSGDYWIMAIYDRSGTHTFRKTPTDTGYYIPLTFGSPIPSSPSNFLTFCCSDYMYWMTITTDTLKGFVDEQTACKKYTWIDGNTYTASDSIATHVVTSSNGCDSLIQLKLTILGIDSTLTQSGYTLTANDSGESYQWLDCDNNFSILLGDTLNSFTATKNGSYAVQITKNGCVDTSACYNIAGIGLNEFGLNGKSSLYPNPANTKVQVEIPKNSRLEALYLLDMRGKVVLHSNKTTFPVEGVKDGVYFIKLVLQDGLEHQFKLVVQH